MMTTLKNKENNREKENTTTLKRTSNAHPAVIKNDMVR